MELQHNTANSPLVLSELKGSIAYITLNRPEVRNAFNPDVIAQLTLAFQNISTNQSIRVVVLSGNGKAFCAGADLDYMKTVGDYTLDQNVTDGTNLAAMFDAVAYCPAPVIALAHGASMGGANGLLAACDMVIGESNTIFAFSEVKVGIIPAVISPYVLNKMQTRLAHELMLTGRKFTAQEALAGGLINYIVEKEHIEQKLNELINELLTASPLAVAQCKQLLRDVSQGIDTNKLRATTTQYLAQARATDEGKEGLRAFLEKRKPYWIE